MAAVSTGTLFSDGSDANFTGLLRNPLKSFIISVWLHPNIAFPGHLLLNNLFMGCASASCWMRWLTLVQWGAEVSDKACFPSWDFSSSSTYGSSGDLWGTPHTAKSAASSLSWAQLWWQQVKVVGVVSREMDSMQQGSCSLRWSVVNPVWKWESW